MTTRRGTWFYAGLEVGVTLLIVAAAWLFTTTHHSYTVPTLPEIASAFHRAWLFDRFGSDVVPSLSRMALGYGVAVVLGIAIGLGLGAWRVARLATLPLVSFMRSMPGVALLPVALVLFGIGTPMQVFIIAFACVWPIVINVTDGVREGEAAYGDTVRMYGIRGLDRTFRVMLPAIGSRIFAGLRTSLSLAVLLLVVSEMVGSTNGIGHFILEARQRFAIPEMWAGIVLLGMLGYLLNLALVTLERRALFWLPEADRRGA